MEKLYDHKVNTYAYILLVIAATVFISILYSYFAPNSCTSVTSPNFICNIWDIAKSIIVGLWAALFTAILVWFFSPAKKDERYVKVISGSEINRQFERMLSEKKPSWYFKGNRARYLCSHVLPSLVNRSDKSFHIECIFLDPSNTSACDHFVQYKKSSHDDDEGGDWNRERIQVELISSIILCGYFHHKPFLNLSIHLSDTFSPIRVDSNGSKAIKTVENKRQPALLIEEPFFYLDWFQREFNTKKLQSRNVVLNSFPNKDINLISSEEVNNFLMEIFEKSKFTEKVIQQALEHARKNENPYK